MTTPVIDSAVEWRALDLCVLRLLDTLRIALSEIRITVLFSSALSETVPCFCKLVLTYRCGGL